MRQVGYSKSFIFSVILHVVVITALLFSFVSAVPRRSLASAKAEVVQAVVVDEKSVVAEVERLKNIEITSKRNSEKKQKAAEAKLKKMEQQRLAEEKKLAKLKTDMAKAKKDEEKRLSELKAAKSKQQKELSDLKAKKQKEQEQLAAIKKEQAEKKSLEEKRQAELAAQEEREFLTEKERWMLKWVSQIEANRRVFDKDKELLCELQFIVLPDGSVREVNIAKSSGDSLYDEESKRAVYRAEPFELPEDPRLKKEFLGRSSVILRANYDRN